VLKQFVFAVSFGFNHKQYFKTLEIQFDCVTLASYTFMNTYCQTIVLHCDTI